EFLEKSILVAEKMFEGRPELLVHLLGLGTRKSAYFLPLLLQVEYLLCLLIPFLDPVRLEPGKLLDLISDLQFVVEVHIQFLLQCLQVSIASRIYGIRRGFKALPNTVFVFDRYGPDVVELMMEFVKVADDVLDYFHLPQTL